MTKIDRFLSLKVMTLFCLLLSSCSQQSFKPASIIYTVDFSYLEGCETGKGECKPITITRKSILDTIKMIFPSGGTQSDIYLFRPDSAYPDSAYIRWMSGLSKATVSPLRHDQKRSGEGLPSFDLTGLSDGKYTANMLSCGLGGSFSLVLATKN